MPETKPDLLLDLFNRQHLELVSKLSTAHGEEALRALAADSLETMAMLLSGDLCAPMPAVTVFNVPLWYAPNATVFLERWPDYCANNLDLKLPALKGRKTGAKLQQIAKAMRPRKLMLIGEEGPDTGARPLLVLDYNQARINDFIAFLFQLVLRRQAGNFDRSSLNSYIRDVKSDPFEELFRVTSESDEARENGLRWLKF